MKRSIAWILNGAAVLFGFVAATASPSFAAQAGSCNDRGSVACAVTSEWTCETWGVCVIPGNWFPCCWEDRITMDFDYYENT